MSEKSNKQQRREIVAQITEALGETGETPIKAIKRVVRVLGKERAVISTVSLD